MSFLSFVTGFQKLRIFLTTMFPRLERLAVSMARAFHRLMQNPRVTRTIGRVRGSHLGQTTENWMRRSYSRDYAKYQVDAGKLPHGAVTILRPVFVIAVSLCLLLPIAMQYPYPAARGHIEGAQGAVAVWSILLWLVALALAWSCLLVGSLISNRAALLVSLILYLYFFGLAAMGASRSFLSLLIVVVPLAAIAIAEHRSRGGSRRDLASGAILSVVVGMASGIVLIALTPLARVFAGHVFFAGIAAGSVLGTITMLAPRYLREKTGRSWNFAPAKCLVFFFAVIFADQVFLMLRGGIEVPANAALAFLTMWTGYLWPLYYFIGVSVIIKVMGWSKDLAQAIQQLIPSRFFTAVLVLLTVAATCIGWNQVILNTPKLPWPTWLVGAAAWLYRVTTWIWADPIGATTWQWLRWVFLFDLAAVVWLLVRRRLDSQVMSSLLFLTVFAGALIYEYMFRISGFSRTGVHSAIMLFTFSIGILWMVHTNGMKFTAKSSPSWPQLGRFAIHGALLLFVLISVHARGAIQQTKIVDEMFLYLFDGMIVIGIPYSLYAYATRRLRGLPISIAGLFGAFSFGAVFCFLITAADKLVIAGGSFHALAEMLERYRQMILKLGVQPREQPVLPEIWLVTRGALVLAGVAVFGFLARRRAKGRHYERASMIFLVIGAAMGFAAFSRLSVTLPLVPLTASILITPFQPALTLSADLVATYLVYTLPAMILALAAFREAPGLWNRRTAGIAAAFLAQALLALAWPREEAALRSAGALATAGAASLLLFFALILAIRTRVENVMELPAQAEASGPGSPDWYIGSRTLKVLTGSACVLLLAITAVQLYGGRMRAHPVPGIRQPVSLPVAWVPAQSAAGSGSVRFTRRSMFPRAPALLVETIETGEIMAAPTMLKGFAREAASNLPGFAASRLEDWDTHFRGSAALDFTFDVKLPNGLTIPLAATRLVVPLSEHDALAATLIAMFDDWEQERWDLVRLVEDLRRQAPRSER